MEELPDVRVGTVEREDALRRLSDHFAAGRLSVAEFDERSAVVAAAVTRGDLAGVFTDLPQEPAASPPERAGRSGVQRPERLMAVLPIIAVILFFTTGSWLWFLMIPIAGALLFRNERTARRRRRRERRGLDGRERRGLDGREPHGLDGRERRGSDSREPHGRDEGGRGRDKELDSDRRNELD
ncbi:DUF1707 domain-containing protein [Nocardia sp. NEAU-351]|uniref:DUF1707 domain-containing protein n=1 Tax=Nocardia bovistercoris TaxID=2785916 RepID=A0A931ICS7_9NOCA|nr:DUF1707 domain-containing protein [Nocardia bovistercoris]